MNPPAPPASSDASRGGSRRVTAAGKYLARDGSKLFLRGVSYGSFAPNARGEPFPDDARLKADLSHIRSLGFNAVRLYELPDGASSRQGK